MTTNPTREALAEKDQPAVYSSRFGLDDKHYVEGPGNGFGYSAGTLWPHLRFTNEDAAQAAAALCNTAYAEGYAKAQRDIRNAIGLKDQS